MKYRVHIEYEVPMFAEVDVDAMDKGEAYSLALHEFKENNPEAIEPTVIRTETLH